MDTPNNLSRRALLGGLAAVGSVAACSDPVPSGPSADVTPLNALLAAEYEAIKAYEEGLTVLRSPMMGDPMLALSRDYARLAARWQSQHRDHAAALVNTIRANLGTPILESSVTFTRPPMFTGTITNVLKLACNREKAAARTYNDAVKTLKAAGNRFVAGSIEGDETQHFIFLYALLKGVVQPGATILEADAVPASFVSTIDGVMNGAGFQNTMLVTEFAYGP